MSQQTEETEKTGPDAAQRLKTLFEEWLREDAKADYRDKPSWEETKKALNEGRPSDGKPFPGE